MRLRLLGIYALPDGSEYVADASNGGGYELYPRRTWDFYRSPAYSVTREGKLLAAAGTARWCVEQLKDTGGEAQYPLAARLL